MVYTHSKREVKKFKRNQKAPELEVKHAVILAAGNSTRFKAEGTMLPKVLLKVGGLRLLERSILTLQAAGIEHFRVVIGDFSDQIVKAMSKIKRLQSLDIEYVKAENYHLGNGASLAAGAGVVEEPFLLTMSDHIFSTDTIKDFVKQVKLRPAFPSLACDSDIEGVFDLDDATKVLASDGRIVAINKELEDYNLIDIGLFYFPEGFGPRIKEKMEAGAHSVSNIVGQFMNEEGMRVDPIENATWQDVDNPSMLAEAERRLLKSLTKETDGWVSKNINRFFSTRISLFLSRFGVTPNQMTTFVFFFTLLGAWYASTGEYLWIALGGLIFQIASILDGCDGELARLGFKGSQFGAWYDTLTDNLRYILFFAALGIGGYNSTGWEYYYYGAIVFFILGVYISGRMALFTWRKKDHLTNLQVTKEVDELAAKSDHWWDKIVKLLRGLDKQDVSAFVAFILCLLGLYKVMFWLVCFGSVFVSITITRTFIVGEAKEKAKRFEANIPTSTAN